MANTCVTRYVIYTRKDVEGLNTIRQRIINGHPFNYDGHWVDLYEEEEVGPIEKAAHGYYFIFVTDTANVPCNELVDDLWREWMQKLFPDMIVDMYAQHIDYDYDRPATVNIW